MIIPDSNKTVWCDHCHTGKSPYNPREWHEIDGLTLCDSCYIDEYGDQPFLFTLSEKVDLLNRLKNIEETQQKILEGLNDTAEHI